MATAIRIEALPARLGDCLLVECPREGTRPWRMLVDGGPPDTWPRLEARLKALPDPAIDVAVVTHIDSDHIGGFIPFVLSPHARDVGDFWFNGARHLVPAGEMRSTAQGDTVVSALTGATPGLRAVPLPWNVAFGGGPVRCPDPPDAGRTGAPLPVIEVPGGPRLTILSPTPTRLRVLGRKWNEVEEELHRGPELGVAPPMAPPPLGDLEDLMPGPTTRDPSAPNGSSIAFLLEHRGASAVLSGDAFGNVLALSLAMLAVERGSENVPVDLVKLPHHGSVNNVLAALVQAAPARHYLVSTNGDTFNHPDDAALARVVLGAPRGAELWFNYRTPRTLRWAEPALQARYGFTAHLPAAGGDDEHTGDGEHGIVAELPERT